MGKSIESIWKEGFLKDDALVAPKLNDLYNQKSIHLLDKFEKMYKWNLIFLVVFSIFVLIISIPIGMKYMGVPLFFIFNGVVIYSKKHLKTLEHIDKNKSSYDYLKSFQNWLQERISMISKVYTFVYPMIFLSVVAGFWFLDFGDKGTLGENVYGWIKEEFPNTIFIGNAPLFGIILVIVLAGILSFFSEKMYQYDLEALYGGLIKKLDELVTDMEKLK